MNDLTGGEVSIAVTAQKGFTQTVRALLPSERLRLAAPILQGPAQSGVAIVDWSDMWSIRDQQDSTTISLQNAANLYPDEVDLVQLRPHDDAPKRRMPELSPDSRRLAHRMVQDRGILAVSRVGDTGLSTMSAICRISRRKDRAGTAWGAPGKAAFGPGGDVGRISGCLSRRNATRVYIFSRSRIPVRELLDFARDPAGRRRRASKSTGAVK